MEGLALHCSTGQQSGEALTLPLHQYLKLQRRRDKKGEGLSTNTIPDEYRDAMTGTLMKDPVQLPTSGTVRVAWPGTPTGPRPCHTPCPVGAPL